MHEDKIDSILMLIGEVWDEVKKSEPDMDFAYFFNAHIVDTCIGGNLSPLFAYTDDDIESLLQAKINTLQWLNGK
jgi:hypothetical protein